MLRMESVNRRRGFVEARRMMWAYARQTGISYFYLLCHERALYALYDGEMFCGCVVRGTWKEIPGVLCLVSKGAYCGQAARAEIAALAGGAPDLEAADLDILHVRGFSAPAPFRLLPTE